MTWFVIALAVVLATTSVVAISGTPATLAGLFVVEISGGDFVDAELASMNLRNANATAARFNQADLRGANLSFADLTFADLTLAHLEATDLSLAVGLTRSQADSAITDEDTILPELEEVSAATPGG